MMVAKFFLCMLLWHVACKFAIARQTDTLDKLYFDPINLKRVAGYGDITTTSSDYSVAESRIYSQYGLKEKDMISKLPGQPEGVNFDQYGGYITVDEKAGRALFYYFAEAPKTTQNSSKPLLLWLNGGPGCSSLGYGAMEELGPFRVMSDGKTLFRNPYAWNNVANVLFLESPAGVGFSYSNTTTDYEASGDRKTAEDSYIFLVNWLERFPEYKGRDFFITGESYAGHYVPQLAETILHHNRLVVAGTANGTTIHLKGIMIGNAVINDETDSIGMIDYFWTHALISDEAVNGIHKYCNFSPNAIGGVQQQCLNTIQGINIGNINFYNIYAPRCSSTSGATPTTLKRYSMENFDPCTDDYVTAYLNNVKVQESLHTKKFNYSWSVCSSQILNWLDSPSTVLPLLKEFIANDIRVWVYSGDIDGRVPVTSTRYSLSKLKLPVKPEYEWRPWSINNEVGGYTFTYEGNLTFVTVRGAGHQVPSYQPLRALALVKSFVEGKSLPS